MKCDILVWLGEQKKKDIYGKIGEIQIKSG